MPPTDRRPNHPLARWSLVLFATLLILPATAMAGSYKKTQKQQFTPPGAPKTFSFTNLDPAAGMVNVQVELWGNYENSDRDKFANVDIDGMPAGSVCQTGCSPSCNRTPHTKTFSVAASTVADGQLDVTIANNSNIGSCNMNLFQVTVTYKTNPSPTVDDQELRLAEDTSTPVTLTGKDPEGDSLTWMVTDQPSHGSLSGTAPKLTYTPDADYNGNDRFRFVADDGQTRSAEGTVSIVVTPVNDPPMWVMPTQMRFPVTAGDRLTIDAEARDPDEDPIDYGIVDQPNGSTFDAGPGDFTWDTTTDDIGTYEVTFTATDGEATIRKTVIVEVVRPEPGDTGIDAGDAGDVGVDGGDAEIDTGMLMPDTGRDTSEPDVTTPDVGADTTPPRPSYELQGGGCTQVPGRPGGPGVGLLVLLGIVLRRARRL